MTVADRAAAPTACPDAANIARQHLGTLLLRVGDQDRAAFAEVYVLTSAKLFGICRRVCGEPQAAEEVLHEVYITVWRRAGRWNPDRGSAITWLATMARNRSIDWRRSRTCRPTSPLSLAENVPDPAPCAERTALVGDEARRVRDSLRALAPHQRDAITSAFFEGATYPELATRYDVPLGTMKSWVRRGLAVMKQQLAAGQA